MNRIRQQSFLSAILVSSIVAWSMSFIILTGTASARALTANGLFEQFTRTDDIREKKSSLERLKALEPNSAYGHFAKGWIFNYHHLYDEAIEEYREAIRMRLDFAEAHNGLANVYYNQDKPDQALAEYQAAIFLNPAYIDAHLNIAILYFETNRLDQAIASYLAVIRINPKHAIARNNLGNIYYRQGALAKAIRAYKTALEINPNLAETYFNLALALEDSDQPAEALKQYRVFLRLAKDDYPAKSELARERIKELTVENSRLKL
jgi:tetratricopeptide (TPR) repeat protein